MREQREKAIFAITSEIGNIISESRQHGTRNIDDISNVISSCMSFSGNANIFKRRGIRKRIEQYKETINWEDAKNKFSDHNLNFHPMLGYKNKGIAAIHLEKIKEIIEK